MTFREDNRGLAIALVKFIFVLAIGAMLFVLFDSAAGQLFTTTLDQAPAGGEAETQINNAKGLWELILFFVLFAAGMFLILRAVNENRIGGPP